MTRPKGNSTVELLRSIESDDIALTNAVGTTPEIDVSAYSYGSIILPAGVTALTFYGSRGVGRTYALINDITPPTWAAGGWALPSQCFGYGAIKIVTNINATCAITLRG